MENAVMTVYKKTIIVIITLTNCPLHMNYNNNINTLNNKLINIEAKRVRAMIEIVLYLELIINRRNNSKSNTSKTFLVKIHTNMK